MTTPAWTLHGSGRRSHDTWHELHQITHGWTAAWADTTGFHLEPMPTEPPLATHLWAWTTEKWLRVRLDTPHWWAGILTPTPDEIDSSWNRETIEKPDISDVLHWNNDDGRIQHFRDTHGILDQDFIQLVPLRHTTAPFLGHRDSRPHSLPEQHEPAGQPA